MISTESAPRAAARTVRVLAPGDAGWDAARATFNLLDDQRPSAIALPRTADEVAEAVAIAQETGLRLAAQGTGHGASARASLDGTMLVNTSAMTEVDVDVAARRVRVGAAAKWQHVAPLLSEAGLAGLHGSSLDVGIAGYSLGGGIGWLSRKHGLQANALRAVELITADGELLRADTAQHADLFWALRGGGGNFGVVTALEFDVVAVDDLASGQLFFPVERAGEVLRAWRDILPALPEELTTWVVLFHFPPIEDVPEPVRGRSFAVVMAAHLGTEAEARRLLQPLLELGPVMDTLSTQDPLALGTLAMDPEDPLPYRSTTALVDHLPDETLDALVRTSGEGSALTLVQFRHIGGALARRPAGAGARATLAGEILVFGIGVPMDPESDRAVRAALAELDTTLAPLAVGAYPNLVEHPTDASAFFDAATWARLQDVKAAYDADDTVRGNHHVPAPRAA